MSKTTNTTNRHRWARTALIAVDIQFDFFEDGALPVPQGSEVVVPTLLAADLKLDGRNVVDVVVASRDDHPEGHCSWVAQGGPWPEHCKHGTPGAEIDPAIRQRANIIIEKGTCVDKDAYSAFDGTDLAEQLHELAVEHVVLTGLAGDICVYNTALGALDYGFQVTVLADACRPISAADFEAKLTELAAMGAHIGGTVWVPGTGSVEMPLTLPARALSSC
jgi:nicotinamidase/pyrazinamidase